MNRSKLLPLLIATLGACGAAVADDGGSIPTYEGVPLTRAEVLADLQVWRESGMAALEQKSSEAGPELYGADYRKAQARYFALRNSPMFASRVHQIALERGDVMESASAN